VFGPLKNMAIWATCWDYLPEHRRYAGGCFAAFWHAVLRLRCTLHLPSCPDSNALKLTC